MDYNKCDQRYSIQPKKSSLLSKIFSKSLDDKATVKHLYTNTTQIVVISPHADDEIFALDILRSFDINNNKIRIIYISCNKVRSNEALKSAKFLFFEKSLLEDQAPIVKDGSYHNYFLTLKSILEKYIQDSDIVLCPALEGGHQDHDTIAIICMILNREKFHNNKKFLYYPCYAKWGECGIFKVQSTSRYYKNYIKIRAYKKWALFEKLFLVFGIYKSQFKTWLLLTPGLIVGHLIDKKYAYIENNISSTNISDIFSYITDTIPLYEIHGRVKRDHWQRKIKEAQDVLHEIDFDVRTDSKKWTRTLCEFFNWYYVRDDKYMLSKRSKQIHITPLYAMQIINKKSLIENSKQNHFLPERLNPNKAIYYINVINQKEEGLCSNYNKNRKRDLQKAQKKFKAKICTQHEAIAVLETKRFDCISRQFFLSFGTPPLPTTLLSLLIEDRQLLMINAIGIHNEKDYLLGSIFLASCKNEYWIPWIIYDKLVDKYGLSTFLWHNAIEFAISKGASIVNLGTSIMDSGPAKFKESLGCNYIAAKNNPKRRGIAETMLRQKMVKYFLKHSPSIMLKSISYKVWKSFSPYV